MSGRSYAERNLAQGLHLVSLMKNTDLEKDSPASSVPRACYEPPTSSTSEVGLFRSDQHAKGRNQQLK